MASTKKRLFVGNLPSKSSQADVRKKLGRFGNVQSVEMKQRTDSEGNILSSFAFVDIENNASDLENCFQYFKNELWHRQQVNVQLAKESFLERLKREQMSAKNSPKSAMHTPVKELTVDSNNFGKPVKLQTPCDFHGSERTFSSFQDEPQVSKKTSLLESARSRALKRSPKLRSEAVDDGVCERKETKKYWNGVQEQEVSRGNGLPMFGGTGFIVEPKDIIVSDNLCDIHSHKRKEISDKVTKFSSPNSCNNFSRVSCAEPKNTVEVQGDVSDNERKGNTPRNKNLLMFCGTKELINSEKCVKVKDSQSDSTPHKLFNRGVKSKIESLESNLNSVNLTKSVVSGNNPQDNNHDVESPRSEVNAESKSKKVNRISTESPRIHENKSGISPGRNIVKPKNDQMADRKRLNALEERKKVFSLQKDAVQKALSSVDLKNPSNKKIIFDDDDDDLVPEALESEKRLDAPHDSSRPKLFQDGSDDEDIKNLESTEFKIKPQFEGRQGQRLLEIQSRYGHDNRFNLDERFLESDDESNPEETPAEEDLNAEKDHQLNILKEMLGVDVTTRKPKRDKMNIRDSLQMVRFDPTNPEHSKYLVKEEDLKKTKKKKGKKREAEDDVENSLSKKAKREEVEEPPVPVTMERFYKVSDKLQESLRNKTVTSAKEGDDLKQAGGFSLLRKFGSPPSDNEEEEVEYSTKAITRNRNEWEKNPFRYDSSEEEEEDEERVEKTKTNEETPVKSDAKTSKVQNNKSIGVTETFYFREKDPRLQEGLDFFDIKKTFAEMQEGFNERRADLKLIIKAKVRNNKRRNRPLKKKLGGARRHKKNMAMFGSKR